MLETLIAILLSLGLNFTKTDTGTVQLDAGTMSKLESSEDYQKTFSSEESPIVIVPDIDPNK
jgi:hypothetical protein